MTTGACLDFPRSPACDLDGDGVTDSLDDCVDVDGDGYGRPEFDLTGCTDGAPDCDDERPDVNPGADEVCDDGLDNDCDGTLNGCGLSGELALGDADAWIAGDGEYRLLGRAVATAGDLEQDGGSDLLVGRDGEGAVVLRGEIHGQQYLHQGHVSEVIDPGGSTTGAAVAGGVDVDGDDVPDLLIGAWGLDQMRGLVFLVSGAEIVAGDVDLGDSQAHWSGVDPDDRAGEALALPGDLDGDGQGDAAIGAPGAGAQSAGALYLLLAEPVGQVDLSLADGIVRGVANGPGDSDGGWLGSSVAAAGDVDGDGGDDVLVGAPYDELGGSNGGAAYLVPGTTTGDRLAGDVALAVFMGEDRTLAGTSVAGAGDVDGDGQLDVLIGAAGDYYDDTTNPGRAHLVFGPLDHTVDLAVDADVVTFEGETISEMAGQSVALADTDGDGRDDVLIGVNEPQGADPAAAFLFHASAIVQADAGTLRLSEAGATFRDLPGADPAQGLQDSTVAVARAGDVNGDGIDDILLGATDGGVLGQGCAFLYYGSGL